MQRFILVGIATIALTFSIAAMGIAYASTQSSPAPSPGTVPSLVAYQGVLSGPNGPVPDATYEIFFTLYTTPSADVPVWNEQHVVDTVRGVFNVFLGENTPLVGGVFENSPLCLGFRVDGESEMVPRQLLASIPFAIQAGNAYTLESLDSSAFARRDTAGGTLGGEPEWPALR